MDNVDKTGVLVVLESSIAVTTAALGTPMLGLAQGLVPVAEYYLDRVRGRSSNVEDLMAETLGHTGATSDDFLSWLSADETRLRFFHDTIEAAWQTFDKGKVTTLAYVLADGFKDSAQLDVDALVVKALRDFDPPHMSVLEHLCEGEVVDDSSLRNQFAHLSVGIDPILSTLSRHACCKETLNLDEGNVAGPPPPRSYWEATDFGQFCLRHVRLSAQSGAQPGM